MKEYMFLIIGIIVCCSGCLQKKNQKSYQQNGMNSITILGKPQEIENKKDGLLIKIKTKHNKIYHAGISISNLDKNEEFKVIELGKNIALKGDFWKLGNKNRLTVRKILSVDNDQFEISGIVKSISYGDDGYTAEIITDDGDKYVATISIPNLGKNHEKYKNYKNGERIIIIGELWEVENKLHITVRNIINN